MSGADIQTDVLVIGGGMAGLAGALAVSRNGQRVTLLEKADEFGEVGAVHRALSNLRTGFRWPMYDREPTDTWRDGRMLLLGDAAHPMLQYLAQGACQAIEDAAALERVTAGVDLADEGRLDVALSTFVAERAPRTARVQRTAREWGEAWHVGGVGRDLRNKLFSSRADGDLAVADWLYGEQPAGLTTISSVGQNHLPTPRDLPPAHH
jgi:2-polyprenyl-6-methoxyphenol hydroxylase-like FAD-dependent oxidoreductase